MKKLFLLVPLALSAQIALADSTVAKPSESKQVAPLMQLNEAAKPAVAAAQKAEHADKTKNESLYEATKQKAKKELGSVKEHAKAAAHHVKEKSKAWGAESKKGLHTLKEKTESAAHHAKEKSKTWYEKFKQHMSKKSTPAQGEKKPTTESK